jgi:hypothetical protein
MMAETKEFVGLISIPATDLNFTGGIKRLPDEVLPGMLDRLIALNETEGGHKGRIKEVEKELKRRAGASKEILAVEKMAEDIQTAEELYSDGMPYELERIENEVRFYQDQAGSALLEMGKRLARIKAHEGHGKFLETLERLNMAPRSAQYAMLAARKFSNAPTLAHLGDSKAKALTVLEEDDIKTLEDGGKVNGMTLSDIERMTMNELRKNLQKSDDALKKEKDARKKDRETQEAAIAQKEQKINELDQQLRYQQPPAKEQLAFAALTQYTVPYTFALAEISAGIRKAHSILCEAEKTSRANVQQISDWLKQFDGEMENIIALKQCWTDEVDEPGEWVDGNAEIIFGGRADVPTVD